MTVTTETAAPPPPDEGDAVAAPNGPLVDRAVADETRPPTARSPWWMALAIVCALAILAQAVLTVRVVAARHDLAELDQQLADRDRQLHELTTELTSTRLRLEALRTDSVDRQTESENAVGSLSVRQIEITELTSDIARMEEKSTRVRADIGKASTVDQEQVRQLLLLTKCLNGIKQANLAAAAGRTNDIVASLKSVSDICQQTLAIMSPGETADFPFDFADPSVVYAADGKYYAYATNGGGGKVQVISSADLKTWNWVGEALGRLPGWAVPGYTWAPSVLRRDNTYFLYYTARHAASGRQCTSVAKASSPAGPFVDSSAGPFVCQLDRAGSIDPSPFVASDGTTYLLWKSEGEVAGGSSWLWIGKLGEDLTSLDGDPTPLVRNDRIWEGRTIEAPSMAEANGRFYLFYSGNRWDTADYATGYAVCEKPTGPCAKPADNVFLAKHDNIDGPGGTEVFVAPGGQPWVSFHAWTHPHVGYPNKRQLHVERLQLGSGRPVVG